MRRGWCLFFRWWLGTAMTVFSLLAYSRGQSPDECKLSRGGPPATIVTIDEESPNGRSNGPPTGCSPSSCFVCFTAQSDNEIHANRQGFSSPHLYFWASP
ncbi:unnamed protein product [Arctogadus glacialis]